MQLPTLPPYTSKELFSKRFLEALVRKREEWIDARPAAHAARATLRELLARQKKHLPAMKEAQLEEVWVKPVLRAVGAVFDVQLCLPTSDRRVTKSPDYGLFADLAEQEAASPFRESGGQPYYERVRLVGEAKSWGVSFYKSGGHAEDTPEAQLAHYLFLTGCDWGLLTNGKLWRLVHRSTAGRFDCYYQVDLVDALDAESIESFLYFYLFFRGDALRPPSPGAPCFLDQARSESLRYAEDVGADLKASVYEALRLLGRGYVSRHPRADLPDEATLGTECLVLLYRLLFLFYAEHRGLLPLNTASYGDYSLSGMARKIAADLDAGKERSPTRSALWAQLSDLFSMVDRGDATLGIPAYNGGLFSDKEHPLLAERGPGDRDLARAIDLIARTRAGNDQGKREPIDYRDLEIRHLGTIYEGLLEYRLRIAATALAVVKSDDKGAQGGDGGRYLPWDQVRDGDFKALSEDRRVEEGDTYLVTDRGERHVTGSFYTPDYIVQYIVEETLGPLVKDRTPQAILALRVVDPAMGSGHFLLAATDYLAQAYGLARIASGEDADGVLTDDELTAYRRTVAEHCIYGVDLNPMAVELAKLALWLKTMARDRALTFLDIHLKCGNALLGVRVDQVGSLALARAAARGSGRNGGRNGGGSGGAKGARSGGKTTAEPPPQMGLFEPLYRARLSVILGHVAEVLGKDTETRVDVQHKEDLDAIVRELRHPFVQVADVQSAALLGSATGASAPAMENLVGLLHRPDALAQDADVQRAAPLAAEKRFFHWELIFPEVYFASRGQTRPDAGFDAVIGNPPWVRQESLAADKTALAALYPEVFDSVADIYVFFIGRSIQLLHDGGRMGLVLPNKWQRADYGEPLRRFLVEKSRPLELTDFGHAPIFPDADTFPCILLAEKGPPADQPMRFCAVQREDLPGINLGGYVKRKGYDVALGQLRAEGWTTVPPEIQRLLDKIRSKGRPLKEIAKSSPLYGVKTGLNEAFLIGEELRSKLIQSDPGCDHIIKKFLRGENIKRWRSEWRGEWMIVLKSSENADWPWATDGIDAETSFATTFPSVHKHLKAHQPALQDRQDQGRYWWELRSCDYYDRFDLPKLVYQEIQFHSRFALDIDGLFLNNKAFFVSSGDAGLLGTLNSSLIWFYLWFNAPHMKDEAFAMQSFMVEQLPIVPASAATGDSLASLARDRRDAESEFLNWLRYELSLPKLNQKVEAFWKLDEPAFIAELKKLKAKLPPAALKQVKEEFDKSRARILPNVAQARALEKQLHAEVFRLYGLTDEEIALVRRTAPPRDPLTLVEQEALP